MNTKKLGVLVAVSALMLTGCATAASDDGATSSAAPATSEATPVASDIKICIYTHGEGGAFWAVLQNGADQAGIDLGLEIDYQGSSSDSALQAQIIDAGVAAGCDGIAASAPDPGAITSAMQAATAAGIPLVTINSGAEIYRDLGAFTHVGQDEIVAGREAGLRFKALGVQKVLCPIHEAANIGLQERCQGAQETHGNVVNFNLDGGLMDLTAASAKIRAELDAAGDYDAIFGLNADITAVAALPAAEDLGLKLVIGTVDMSGDALDAIKDGRMSFAIDQQQYAQGYLAVTLLYLNIINKHVLGGGLPMYTGPGFVDESNVEDVISLVQAGTR